MEISKIIGRAMNSGKFRIGVPGQSEKKLVGLYSHFSSFDDFIP